MFMNELIKLSKNAVKRYRKYKIIPRVSLIYFGILADYELISKSILLVNNKNNYFVFNSFRVYFSCSNGAISKIDSLGCEDFKSICRICGYSHTKCQGHEGCILFELPVYNTIFIKNLQQILSIICYNCFSLLSLSSVEQNFKRFSEVHFHVFRYNIYFYHRLYNHSYALRHCRNCYSFNGRLRCNLNFNKFILEGFKTFIALKTHFSVCYEPCYYAKEVISFHILKILKFVTVANNKIIRISSFLSCLMPIFFPVSSKGIRADFYDQSKKSLKNKINIIYLKLIRVNNRIYMLKANEFMILSSLINFMCKLQNFSNTLVLKKQKIKSTRDEFCGILYRLVGKKGRIRHNILGKRTDFSSRAVITPNPKIDINYLSLGVKIFLTNTTSLTINKLNEKEYNRFRAVYKTYPNIIYITKKERNTKYCLGRLKKNDFLFPESLDLIERNLLYGDFTLFNRQPSLHRVSMMSHLVTENSQDSISFNPLVCSPYNADFDGDEMNLFFIHDTLSLSEALNLMLPQLNLKLKGSFKYIIALIQDMLYLTYIKSGKEKKYFVSNKLKIHKHLKKDYLNYMDNRYRKQNVGGNLFLLKKLKYNKFGINCINFNESSMIKKINYRYFFEVNSFVNYKFIEGLLTKENFSSIKNNFLEKLEYLHSVRFIRKYFKFSLKSTIVESHLESLTISLKGFRHRKNIIALISQVLKSNKIMILNSLNFFLKTNMLHLSILKKLRVNYKLNLVNFRNQLFSIITKKRFVNDCLKIMIKSGSKGSRNNSLQMVGLLGIQNIVYESVNLRKYNLKLCFKPLAFSTNENFSYIDSCFFDGLSYNYFFVHTIAGRESTVESSIKTSDTGYLSRKLNLTISCAFLHYDNTLRNTNGEILVLNSRNETIALYLNKFFKIGFEKVKLITHFQDKVLDNIKKSSHFNFNIIRFQKILINSSIRNINFMSILFQSRFQKNSIILNSIQPKSFLYFSLFFLLRVNYLLPQKDIELKKFIKKTLLRCLCVNRDSIYYLIKIVLKRLFKTSSCYGDSVGVSCAQSISEPCTQMTLKSFHFTGSSKRDISCEFIKLKRLLNISPVYISTIKIRYCSILTWRTNRKILSRWKVPNYFKIEKIVIKKSINKLEIRINISAFKRELSIIRYMVFLKTISYNINKKSLYKFILQKLKDNLIKIYKKNMLKFFVVTKKKFINLFFDLLIEGKFMRRIISEIYSLGYVDLKNFVSNDVIVLFDFVGIVGTWEKIYKDIFLMFSRNKIIINLDLVRLLVDSITHNGKLLGVSLVNLKKATSTTLNLISHEKCLEILRESAFFGEHDYAIGIIESMFVGYKSPSGTGLFEVLH